MQQLRDQLIEAEIDCIAVIDLYDVMYMPMIQTNHVLMIALAEWWHNKTCTFHLDMGEMTMTLEDVWRILHIPIRGDLVTYDQVWGTSAV
ncbi:hypothetical protein SUGI_0508570 [Cryptomeria japonica]|nr:hypothetical protein SUGI_0508570 [Cryptomeria japonica]